MKHERQDAPITREITATHNALALTVPQNAGGYLAPHQYWEILRDEQVKATLQQRRSALVARPWRVDAGGDKPIDAEAAKALETELRAVGWDRVSDLMLYGLFYGWSVAECLWTLDGARVRLSALRVKDRAQFGHDNAHRLIWQKPGGPSQIMPERKFWTFATGSDHDDAPYGMGLALWLQWPVFFKRNGIKFWLVFLEKFSSPTAVGTYPANASDEEKRRLLDAAAALAQQTGIVVPEGFEITLLEAARQGTQDYKELCAYLDRGIAKLILSQTMTTDAGSSRSQAEVHMNVREEVVRADADLLSDSFADGPGRWWTEWNFPGAATPRIVRKTTAEPSAGESAQIDAQLASIGILPTDERVRRIYGAGYARKKEAPVGL